MATVSRRPLASRPLPSRSAPSPAKQRSVSAPKRPRSPDRQDTTPATRQTTKRPRSHSKERKHAEMEAEWKKKYRSAFPSFVFYLDAENMDCDSHTVHELEDRIQHLGGTIEVFFSRKITHLITNRPLPPVPSEKENNPNTPSAIPLKSPIKLKGRVLDESRSTAGFDLVSKAMSFGMKIWTTAKIDSVTARCITPLPDSSSKPSNLNPSRLTAQPNSRRSLTRLLQSERIHGTTERDPTQKRHDYRYFSRASHFVLIEDLRGELATIAAHEYPPIKHKDETANPPWPVLHCHPNARGPFVPFDDREKKRWEKSQQAEKNRESERARQRNRILQTKLMKRSTTTHATKAGDLRRSVSMNNIQRHLSERLAVSYLVDLDANADIPDSANASGFLASGTTGYMAASGNSVSVTSNTGTSMSGSVLRNMQLPLTLSNRIERQVVTSRKAQPAGNMGPPAAPLLRKSKSTSTFKLPKREEGSKPGYCESCRLKFEDFKAHVSGRRHRKFAANEANFLQLDCVLARIQRRTRKEVCEEEKKRAARRKTYCAAARSGDEDICEATAYHDPGDVSSTQSPS